MWKIAKNTATYNNRFGRRFNFNRCTKVIISGQVIDSNYKKICGALIKIEKLEYNYFPCKVTVIGYTLCDCNGNYAIVVDKMNYVAYKLSVYQPIIKKDL